ncbi:MAG: roadblock/LC7 domain-containing protein [Blastochloris sp.]|nr:roadblock/LC7 domain-containing protein [Blastochloris sp.]
MASNFLGLFGKKKEEVLAPQASPTLSAPVEEAKPKSPPSGLIGLPQGRKRVTQRLSLKGLQESGKIAPDPTKIQLPSAVAPARAVPEPVEVDGTVDIPFSIILNSIPEQLLVADHATLLVHPEVMVQIGLPLSHVLSMLPSGKLEFSLSDLVGAIPAGFVQPLENIPDYAQTPISLPLAEVFRRIPPHLLALRSDQRPVDAAVKNMVDPFSKEALEKAQAVAKEKAVEADTQFAVEAEPAPELNPEPIPELVMEESVPEYAPIPEYRAPSFEAPVEPDFDPVMLAEAEAALAAVEARKAGVELPDVYDPILPPPPAYSATYQQEEAHQETPISEPSAEANAWAFPVSGQAEEAAADSEPEMDPALVEWARKMAQEESAAQSGEPQLSEPELPPYGEEETNLGNDLNSSLAQEEAVDPDDVVPPPTPAPGAFEVNKIGMFDALNAPTRPIRKPKNQPQPPEIKGFGSFNIVEKSQEIVTPVPSYTDPSALPEEFDQATPELEPEPEDSTQMEPVGSINFSAPASSAPLLSPRIRLSPTINRYLSLDENAEISFADVMNHVRRWPGVSGCVITGKDGLPISAVVDDVLFSKSLSAFAPKIVARVSELFVDLGMPEVQEIHVPMDDVSTFLFREADVYFILLYKEASLPQWYRKVIKAVLEEIATRHK